MANDVDDPFAPAEGTILRPRPGGARRQGLETQPDAMRAPPPRAGGDRGPAAGGDLNVADFLAGGRNPILRAATPLLTIASRLQSAVAHADVPALRNQAMHEVRAFDDRLRSAGIAPDDALVARYLLCTFFDSAVLNTPWGAQSDWSGQSLLVVFHKEKSGGEKFFQILERVSAQPARYIDVIELQYVCLLLGYEGMYRIDERGQTRLAELQHGLFRIIRDARQLRDEELSPHWQGVEDKRNPIFRYLPWWIVGCAGLAVIVIAFVIYNSRLNAAAAPIKAALSKPSVQLEYSAPAPPRPTRLKELLAPQEQAGQLTVEDFGNKTVVTLIASNLFRSGRADVNREHEDTLRAIALALNEVPGKVLIVGHTDDQPVRSLQFADNFELSRERAVAVAGVLRVSLANFGRVEWVGVGSTQPRYLPVNTSENRARNRRVEIVNVDEGGETVKSLFKLITRKWFLLLMAWLLVALAIWFGGPYLALGDWKPLESDFSRLVAICALVGLWYARLHWRRYRAKRAGNRLANDVSAQAAAKQPAKGSAEAAQLRARFEEAVGALRGSQGKTINLYELPWYIIIGPPGAGKTTVIANSGLNFPLSKKFGKAALRGVGGTRNCDWWFTDEAVLLDTAGRYTTQDSDSESDHAGWTEFLGLLRKHRGRRPINGVIVAMSAVDLLSLPDSERRRHVEAVRNRLDELGRELKITLPVYFLLTKLDLIAGFSEFFDDLSQEGRGQVWGTTFALELSRSGAAASKLAEEFDQLVERLNARLMTRLQSERDVRRRAVMFTFPQQFAALRRALVEFTTDAFSIEGDEPKTQLRGVYFTSGTQEGTPIDRMLSALARAFALNMKSALAPPREGRAYFIQRLLKEILFKESGLAGVNKQVELRQLALNIAAYAGVCLLIVLSFVAFSMSYSRNREYLDRMAEATDMLEAVPPADASDPLITGLDRMDAFAQVLGVARQHADSVPLAMRWGLYQGNSVANAAEDAYLRELNADMLPVVAEHFRSRLGSFAGEPDKLYEYLKAYLMLVLPEHLEPAQLGYIGKIEWERVFANDPVTLERVNTHFSALIADPDRVQPAHEDKAVVEQARNSLKQASLPVLMYSRLKLSYADDTEDAIDVSREIGLGGESVFVRKSGASLSEPMSALYTKPVFKEIAATGQLQLVKQFVSDKWLLGADIGDLAKSPLLSAQLMQLYEDDYIRAWDELLGDITLVGAGNTRDAAQMWGLLAAPTSPLKRLLGLVQVNTMLVEPAKPDALSTKAKAAVDSTVGSLGKVFGSDKKPVAPPGTRVTKHFELLHKLVAGTPPPIDETLKKFASIQSVMADINALGGAPPLEKATQLSLAVQDLQAHSKTLPAPVGGLIARASGAGASVASASIGGDFSARYQQQVVSECQELAAGRYPLAANSTVDLPLADFGRIFAPNGTFDGFFRTTMQTFVDSNRPTWRWKPEATAIGGSASIPLQFQRASRIALTYFPPGAAMPEVRFTVTPDFLDAAASRVLLEIDGQTLEYRHGPQRAVAMIWPGPSPGQAAISLEEPGGARPNIVEQGPWALYRLMGKAEFRAQGETRFLATFTLGGRSVRLIFQANSSRNPFARDLLHGFRCRG